MRVLALDYGRRRIGLAASDALGLTAQPLGTLERTNRRDDLRRLREIVRRHDVRRIVVGHPLRLDGTPGEMAAEAARFAARIEKQLGLPVELVDERLSSWEAEQIVGLSTTAAGKPRRGEGRLGAGKKPVRRPSGAASQRRSQGARRPRSERLDSVAAAVILRDYLERERARLEASREDLPQPRAEQAEHDSADSQRQQVKT